MNSPVLVDVREAARRLGISVSSLHKMRGTGVGPRFVRLGGGKLIRYEVQALTEWVESNRFHSTSEYPRD